METSQQAPTLQEEGRAKHLPYDTASPPLRPPARLRRHQQRTWIVYGAKLLTSSTPSRRTAVYRTEKKENQATVPLLHLRIPQPGHAEDGGCRGTRASMLKMALHRRFLLPARHTYRDNCQQTGDDLRILPELTLTRHLKE